MILTAAGHEDAIIEEMPEQPLDAAPTLNPQEMLLPTIESAAEFARLRGRAETWRAAVEEIVRRHGLPRGELRQYTQGSCVVFAVGTTHVLKLHPFGDMEARERERAALEFVDGRLAVPTPSLVAAGELEGWPYLVVGQLRGQLLRNVWQALRTEERERVVRRLGEVASQLHALPLDELQSGDDESGTPQHLLIDWPLFVEGQARNCVAQQRRHGLGEDWLRQIPAYLAGARPYFPEQFKPSLLHTELTDENILLERTRGGDWNISGLFDFEPSFVGYQEYELPSIAIFIARGEASLLRAFLSAYGYTKSALTPPLRARLMAYTLLHRYSNLRWYMELVPPRATTRSLEELELDWCSFDA